jgi:hypothetical protein
VTEQRIAELLAGAPTLNWHFAFMLGRGSVLLHEFDRFDGIDWWRVGELLTPMVTAVDRTPPLRRAA